MRLLIVFALAVSFCSTAVAQTSAYEAMPSENYARVSAPVSPLFRTHQKPEAFSSPFLAPLEKPPGIVKKSVGQTLTFGGAACFIIGLVIVDSSNEQPTYHQNGGYYYDDDPQVTAGALLAFNGMIMTGIGIPFWIVGGHQFSKYKREQGLTFQMKGTTGSLSYRF